MVTGFFLFPLTDWLACTPQQHPERVLFFGCMLHLAGCAPGVFLPNHAARQTEKVYFVLDAGALIRYSVKQKTKR